MNCNCISGNQNSDNYGDRCVSFAQALGMHEESCAHTEHLFLRGGKAAVVYIFVTGYLFCYANTFAAVTVFYVSFARIRRLGQRENEVIQRSHIHKTEVESKM